jgi:hypothetical protein
VDAVYEQQPNTQRNEGGYEKPCEDFQHNAADRFGILHAGYAGNQRRENQRSYDHFDHAQENISDHRQVVGYDPRPLGSGHGIAHTADNHAEEYAEHDPTGQSIAHLHGDGKISNT